MGLPLLNSVAHGNICDRKWMRFSPMKSNVFISVSVRAFQHLFPYFLCISYNRVRSSNGRSIFTSLSLPIHRSVRPSICLSHIREYQFHHVKARVGQEQSHVITSPYNHYVIMRTHCWPYGPCFIHNYVFLLYLFPQESNS